MRPVKRSNSFGLGRRFYWFCLCRFGARAHLTRSQGTGFCAAQALPPIAWFCCLLSGFLYCSLASATVEILILQSHDGAPYQETLAGFRTGLAEAKLDAVYQTLNLSQSADTVSLAERLNAGPPKLILTLGTPATRLALKQAPNIPIVAGLVLDADEIHQYPLVTGVGLNFSADQQWLWLRRLLPDARQIAVLCDSKQGSVLLQALRKQAQAEGVNLIPATADQGEGLPRLMESLPPQLDALWAIDGAMAYNAAAVRELLLYSFRNRVPLVGLSAQWVKAGALYALDWDYRDLGMQVADLALDILQKGTAPSALAPLSPRKVRPVLNLKTAEHMKLSISEHWLSQMSEVFQ